MLGSIPPMIPESHAVGKRVSELHTILGDAVVWVAGLHAAAALFHHFMLRDVVLTAMLARRIRRPR
jgi:cytochrome b561